MTTYEERSHHRRSDAQRQREHRARKAVQRVATRVRVRDLMREIEADIEREETALLHRLLTEGEREP